MPTIQQLVGPCFRFLCPFTAVKAFFSQTETEIFF